MGCPHLFFGLQSVMTYCRSGIVGNHLCDSFYRTRALSKIMVMKGGGINLESVVLHEDLLVSL